MKVICINESYFGIPLYHYTNINGLIGILQKNMFVGHTETEGIAKGLKVVSTTRDKIANFIVYKPDTVRITLDAGLLELKGYIMKPYDYFNKPIDKNKKDKDGKVIIPPTSRSTQTSESEIIVKGDIKNAIDYILQIDIIDDVAKDNKKVVEPTTLATPRAYFEDVLRTKMVKGLSNTSKLNKDFLVNHNLTSWKDFKNSKFYNSKIRTDWHPRGLKLIPNEKDNIKIKSDIADSPMYMISFTVGKNKDYYFVLAKSEDSALEKFSDFCFVNSDGEGLDLFTYDDSSRPNDMLTDDEQIVPLSSIMNTYTSDLNKDIKYRFGDLLQGKYKIKSFYDFIKINKDQIKKITNPLIVNEDYVIMDLGDSCFYKKKENTIEIR